MRQYEQEFRARAPHDVAPQPPTLGILEWFRRGEYEQVERLLENLRALGVSDLRTGLSWADYHTPEGPAWYDWLLPRLASEVRVLPCLLYTPPSLGVRPHVSSPPRRPRDYADFLDLMITRLGSCFEWIELWNEANNISEWDWSLDPEWKTFAEMIGAAAHWARRRGKRTVLAGMSPIDPNWLRLMFHRGLMESIDVVGIHGFPGVWEAAWEGWPTAIQRVQEVLDEHGSSARIWITETGYSTWRYDEFVQMKAFLDAVQAPAERVYWYAGRDLDQTLPAVDGFHADDREYHFGLHLSDWRPKLLARLWAERGIGGLPEVVRMGSRGIEAPSPAAQQTRRRIAGARQHVLITGGAGFIGCNLADRLLRMGKRVLVLDNLSRSSVEENLRWLRQNHDERLVVEIGDVRDIHTLRRAVCHAEQVYHLSAQVAVTTSLIHPLDDFDVNLRGTMNLLECLRGLPEPPPVLFTSTNKVYGTLADLQLENRGERYEPSDETVRRNGIAEDRPLHFHSPYGCSKGAADQYVLDFAHTLGVPGIVFRMSCVYGPHQFGTEEQGWVAHFLIRALEDEPITLYGDGRQVRDLLYVDDLVNALLLAQDHLDEFSGQAFNIGGGPANTVSLLELIDLIGQLTGREPRVEFDDWRSADQRFFVSNSGKFNRATGWEPATSVRAGIELLYQWLMESRFQNQGAVPSRNSIYATQT